MSWIKGYFGTIIISLALLIGLEISARYFLVVPPSHVQRNYTPEVIAQIYGSSNVADYETVLTEQSIGWEYHPFAEHKESPREGEFVSVSDFNIRCNENGVSTCILPTGSKVIWLFGGSTVFGYGVKNNETIAAHLQNLMPDYQVVNLGHSSYYSTPERILFSEYLSQGLKPEIAIFLDGLNDYYYFDVPDRSAVSNRLRNLFEQSVSGGFWQPLKDILKNSRFVTWLYRSRFVTWLYRNLKNSDSQVTSSDQFDVQADEVLLRVAQRLAYNFNVRLVIGDAFDVRVVNVLQPVPGFGIGHMTSNVPDHLLNFSHRDVNSGRGYEILDRNTLGTTDEDFLDLSNLSSESPMFVDKVHYTSFFNMTIADHLKSFLIE